MKLIEINEVNYGSTGNIMMDIASKASVNGIEAYIAYPSSRMNKRRKTNNHILIGTLMENKLSCLLGQLGYHDCTSFFSTWRLINKLKRIKPDCIHFHNMHGSFINVQMMFNYIKKYQIRVIWTLHDCWAFTGQCPYFTLVNCGKWKTGCGECGQYNRVSPKSIFDRTSKLWRMKKNAFTGVENLTIVTPSEWLAGLVKESFLGEYPIKVIKNGIDLNIFKPMPSQFRSQYQINDGEFVILGVASDWGERKGLDVFVELAKILDKNFRIILVGTNEVVDSVLPANIISIHKTYNQKELAQIYSAADVLVNPTREEVFGLVNAEALACDTPVITFDTGGSAECVRGKGIVVPCDDIGSLIKAILEMESNREYWVEHCKKEWKEFDSSNAYQKYVNLIMNATEDVKTQDE